MDHFTHPVQLVLDGQSLAVSQSEERVDLEQGYYETTPAQVWQVRPEDDTTFVLVRSLSTGRCSKVGLTHLRRPHPGRRG